MGQSLRGIMEKKIRDLKIITQFKEGITPTQLALRHQLSMSQIFHIIRKDKDETALKKELKCLKRKHA